jgi:hypothetical protein
VRIAIDAFRQARTLAVVVLGDGPAPWPDAHALPTCLSTPELVRQLGEVMRRDTVTQPPSTSRQSSQPASSLAHSAPLPRGLVSWPSQRPERGVSQRLIEVRGASPAHAVKAACLVGSNGAIHPLHPGDPLRVGRALDNHVVLDDRSVSRQHALLELTVQGPVVRDCGSVHGLRVNGVKVSTHALQHGDRVHFGRVALHLVHGDRAAAARWYQARRAEAAAEAEADAAAGGAGERVLRGELAVVDLITLLQMLGAQKRSGELRLTREGASLGAIHFSDGRITHAETVQGQTGVEAFYALAPVEQGQFAFRPGVQVSQATIGESLTALILEASRRRDEARAGAG